MRLLPLKHVAIVSVSNVDKKSHEEGIPVRLCNYTDVYYHDRITADLPFMDATATESQVRAFALQSGDVLITKDSETPDDIAVPALVQDDVPGLMCGYHLAILRPLRQVVDGRYLYWALASSVARSTFSSLATGITRFGLRQELIGALPVPVPPVPTQRAIADYLDRETARIDALIAAKKKMIDLLEERDFTLLSRIVVPENAAFARLGHFASLQTGLTVDASRTSESDLVTRPYLRVANVQAGSLDLADVSEISVPASLAARSTLRYGDVLMTEGGDLDKLGRGTLWELQLPDCLHQNHVFAVRPDPRHVDPAFLALLTRTAHARQYFERTGVKTTNLASTNSSKILELPVPVLPLDQQRDVVQRYKRTASNGRELRSMIEQQLDLLAEHRQALITAAVTGELGIPGAA